MTPIERAARHPNGVALVAAIVGWLVARGDPDALFAVGRLALAALLAGAVLIDARRPSPAAALALLLGAGVAVGATVGGPLERAVTRGEVRAWTQFHYYLGASYFDELGYERLYAQVMAADAEGGRHLDGVVERVRDLHTYKLERARYSSRLPDRAWTPPRWERFVADTDALLGSPFLDPDDLRRMLRDRGYNATPVWTTLGSALTTPRPDPRWLSALGLIDPLLLGLALLLLGHAWGPRTAWLVAAWGALFYGNEFHLVGGLAGYVFWACLLAMAALWRLKWPVAAGALLALAAGLRIFPALLVPGIGLWAAARWAAGGRLPTGAVRFAVGLALGGTLTFAVTAAGPRGLSAWGDFHEAMDLHSEQHRFGNKRVGLQHALMMDPQAGLAGPDEVHRRELWPGRRPLWIGLTLLLVALWLAAVARLPEDGGLDALPLSGALVFALLVLSRYYASAGALLLLLGRRERDGPGRAALHAGLFGLIALYYLLSLWIPVTFQRYAASNALWLVWWIAALSLVALRPGGVVAATVNHDAPLP